MINKLTELEKKEQEKKAAEIIKITKEMTVNAVKNYSAKKKPKKSKVFQPLDLLIPKERQIRNIVGGLETSLGKTLWEPLAKALAKANGFEVIEEKLLMPKNMPANLSNIITNILDDRKDINSSHYDASSSHETIKSTCQSFIKSPLSDFRKPDKGTGVDIWLKKKDINYFFDTKTVQPNLEALNSCLAQIIKWYAYFYSRYPKQSASARIVFPYNPYKSKLFWDGINGSGFPLESPLEAWVEDEFWDFCSGYTGTWNLIEKSFKEINSEKLLDKAFENLFKNHENQLSLL